LTAGQANTITVAYDGFDDTITVTLPAAPLPPQRTGVTATFTAPTAPALAYNATLADLVAHITLVVNYDNGDTTAVTVTEAMLSGTLTAGQANTITVAYDGFDDTITVTLPAAPTFSFTFDADASDDEISIELNPNHAVAAGTSVIISFLIADGYRAASNFEVTIGGTTVPANQIAWDAYRTAGTLQRYIAAGEDSTRIIIATGVEVISAVVVNVQDLIDSDSFEFLSVDARGINIFVNFDGDAWHIVFERDNQVLELEVANDNTIAFMPWDFAELRYILDLPATFNYVHVYPSEIRDVIISTVEFDTSMLLSHGLLILEIYVDGMMGFFDREFNCIDFAGGGLMIYILPEGPLVLLAVNGDDEHDLVMDLIVTVDHGNGYWDDGLDIWVQLVYASITFSINDDSRNGNSVTFWADSYGMLDFNADASLMQALGALLGIIGTIDFIDFTGGFDEDINQHMHFMMWIEYNDGLGWMSIDFYNPYANGPGGGVEAFPVGTYNLITIGNDDTLAYEVVMVITEIAIRIERGGFDTVVFFIMGEYIDYSQELLDDLADMLDLADIIDISIQQGIIVGAMEINMTTSDGPITAYFRIVLGGGGGFSPPRGNFELANAPSHPSLEGYVFMSICREYIRITRDSITFIVIEIPNDGGIMPLFIEQDDDGMFLNSEQIEDLAVMLEITAYDIYSAAIRYTRHIVWIDILTDCYQDLRFEFEPVVEFYFYVGGIEGRFVYEFVNMWGDETDLIIVFGQNDVRFIQYEVGPYGGEWEILRLTITADNRIEFFARDVDYFSQFLLGLDLREIRIFELHGDMLYVEAWYFCWDMMYYNSRHFDFARE